MQFSLTIKIYKAYINQFAKIKIYFNSLYLKYDELPIDFITFKTETVMLQYKIFKFRSSTY